MDPGKHLKFIGFISMVSLFLMSAVLFLTQNTLFALLVGLLADSIQIASYLVWLLRARSCFDYAHKKKTVVGKCRSMPS